MVHVAFVHALEAIVEIGCVTETVCVVETDLLDLRASPVEKAADRGEDDADDEEERENRLGREDRSAMFR
jgi:hypothetical protein